MNLPFAPEQGSVDSKASRQSSSLQFETSHFAVNTATAGIARLQPVHGASEIGSAVASMFAESEEPAVLTAHTSIEKRGAIRRRSTGAPSLSQLARPDDVHAHAIREALSRVEVEYREMPGLSLTLPQAARLLNLERSTCELVLTNLVERRILRRAPNGAYVRR